MSNSDVAPGHPGVDPRWTSSRKTGIGTARTAVSHVWFTLSHGILNEIYYPRIDRASIRDMGLIVTDGNSFFSEEKRHADWVVSWIAPGVPAFELTNTCKQKRYEIRKTILVDPQRHVVLQQTRFTPKQGKLADYHLYVLLAPHLDNHGAGNTAWIGEYKSIPMLMAQRAGIALALACSAPWLNRSAGFVGVSDGWQDLKAHKRMTWVHSRAADGNVALTGEIDLSSGGEFLLALGFGRNAAEAAHRARGSLLHGFDRTRESFAREWKSWQDSLLPLADGEGASRYRVSTAVLAAHESKDFPGGTIASLSFPWGAIQGDEDRGGYHLVWPRDAYETSSALLAAGACDQITRALDFFHATQEEDGHWPQNMWLDGRSYWKGDQLDETAAPILLLDLAHRNGRVDDAELNRRWPMVRSAAGYIARNGPATPQDRWEEDAGYTAYTLSSVIAALLIAAEMAERYEQSSLASYFRQTADAWNASIEDWTYVKGSSLAKKTGVDGYYVRISPPDFASNDAPLEQVTVSIANRPAGQGKIMASDLISADALALVRFGLRAADDPRIRNTVKVIDSLLKVETPRGPAWHRYNQDGYGEHADGSPFDGTGIGRAWPLLVGERAHYELAAGRADEARKLLQTMESLADDSGLISEQVWDTADIPGKKLFNGRPSGSARPLVWAHAEHVKLLRSLKDGRVFDTPPQTVARYLKQKTRSRFTPWRFTAAVKNMVKGQILRVETSASARVHWSADNWKTPQDISTRDTTVGLHVADLPTEKLKGGSRIRFTFYWPEPDRWEDRDFEVVVVDKPVSSGSHE